MMDHCSIVEVDADQPSHSVLVSCVASTVRFSIICFKQHSLDQSHASHFWGMTMVRPTRSTSSWQQMARTISQRSRVITHVHRSSHVVVAPATLLGSVKRSTSIITRQVPQSMSFSSNRGQKDDDGWWGLAGDYIKQIRWKAVEELSSQLPEDEKHRIMDKAKQEQSKTDSAGNLKAAGGRNQPSVEELLAEARAQEAQRITAKYEEERKNREAEIERAVRKKLESDLELQRRQIAFEKWQQDLAREKQRQDNKPTPAQPHVDVSAPASQQTSATKALGDHPILGPVVCDLGHKRVHLSTVERLAALPVWEKQRFFRHDRAKNMARDKAKTLHTGLPGVIGILESKDGNLSIIDGQHRIGMLKILSEKKGLSTDFDFDRILVEVYTQPDNLDSNQYATEIFQEINKAQPANLVDLPGAATAEDLEIINMAVANLARKYRDMFSTSTRCRKPHVNEDNVRNELFLNRVIERHEIKSAEDLERWMEEKNQALGETFQSNKTAAAKIPPTALEKAYKFGFYLGLDSQWYDE